MVLRKSVYSAFLLAAVAAGAHAETLVGNFYNDFNIGVGANTPAGPNAYATNGWLYGQTSVAGGAITAFANFTNPGADGIARWSTLATENALVPAAFYDPAGGPTVHGISAGQAALHGGINGEIGVASFLVTSTGTYHISGSFLAGDSGTVDNYVYAGGVQRVADLGQVGATTFDFTAYLTAGQTIDFGVGTAGTYGSDTTPLVANIASVPAPGALAVFGLGLVGKARRRRASK